MTSQIENYVVFYSWQSDLPNNTNRRFIEKALESAIKKLNKKRKHRYEKEVVLDKDIANRTGSPAIAETILEKIERSEIFVADISIVSPPSDPSKDDKPRRIPNPNVLIELGYAAHAIQWERIVCVANIEYGNIEELPFDIRHRSVVGYTVAENTNNDKKLEEKKSLAGKLFSKLAEIIKDYERNDGSGVLLDEEQKALFESRSLHKLASVHHKDGRPQEASEKLNKAISLMREYSLEQKGCQSELNSMKVDRWILLLEVSMSDAKERMRAFKDATKIGGDELAIRKIETSEENGKVEYGLFLLSAFKYFFQSNDNRYGEFANARNLFKIVMDDEVVKSNLLRDRACQFWTWKVTYYRRSKTAEGLAAHWVAVAGVRSPMGQQIFVNVGISVRLRRWIGISSYDPVDEDHLEHFYKLFLETEARESPLKKNMLIAVSDLQEKEYVRQKLRSIFPDGAGWNKIDEL